MLSQSHPPLFTTRVFSAFTKRLEVNQIQENFPENTREKGQKREKQFDDAESLLKDANVTGSLLSGTLFSGFYGRA